MIFEKVKETMVNTLGCDEAKITESASIADDLGIDSLDAVELVMALEEEFGILIFHRSARGIALTEDGREFLSYARQVVEQADLLHQHYGATRQTRQRCSISTQHYAFAVDAFVQLIQRLSSFQGTRTGILIIVFDAYQVKDNPGSIQKLHNLYVVYTKTSQTADSYIEKATHQLADQFEVTVATSDGMEQLIILGQGAMRLSSRELEAQVNQLRHQHHLQEQRNLEPHRPLQELKTLLPDPDED